MPSYSDTELLERGYHIVATWDLLSCINPRTVIRVDGRLYNQEQLFQLIESAQLGNLTLLEEKRKDRYLTRPQLLNQETNPAPEQKSFSPRYWVTHKQLVRRTIFLTALQQRERVQARLAPFPLDTRFLFAKQRRGTDFFWTTGTRESSLHGQYRHFPGKNMLGRELTKARELFASDSPCPLDLSEWLERDNNPRTGAPFGFLVISDSLLKHLAWIESGLVLARGGCLFRNILQLLTIIDSNLFQQVIIHVGILEVNSQPRQAKEQLQQVLRALDHRIGTVWWSLPLPCGQHAQPEMDSFNGWLRRRCHQAGCRVLDSDSQGQLGFTTRNGRLNPELYYPDRLHINTNGVRELMSFWDRAIPDFKHHDRGISARPYCQPYRYNRPETHSFLTGFHRQ